MAQKEIPGVDQFVAFIQKKAGLTSNHLPVLELLHSADNIEGVHVSKLLPLLTPPESGISPQKAQETRKSELLHVRARLKNAGVVVGNLEPVTRYGGKYFISNLGELAKESGLYTDDSSLALSNHPVQRDLVDLPVTGEIVAMSMVTEVSIKAVAEPLAVERPVVTEEVVVAQPISRAVGTPAQRSHPRQSTIVAEQQRPQVKPAEVKKERVKPAEDWSEEHEPVIAALALAKYLDKTHLITEVQGDLNISVFRDVDGFFEILGRLVERLPFSKFEETERYPRRYKRLRTTGLEKMHALLLNTPDRLNRILHGNPSGDSMDLLRWLRKQIPTGMLPVLFEAAFHNSADEFLLRELITAKMIHQGAEIRDRVAPTAPTRAPLPDRSTFKGHYALSLEEVLSDPDMAENGLLIFDDEVAALSVSLHRFPNIRGSQRFSMELAALSAGSFLNSDLDSRTVNDYVDARNKGLKKMAYILGGERTRDVLGLYSDNFESLLVGLEEEAVGDLDSLTINTMLHLLSEPVSASYQIESRIMKRLRERPGEIIDNMEYSNIKMGAQIQDIISTLSGKSVPVAGMKSGQVVNVLGGLLNRQLSALVEILSSNISFTESSARGDRTGGHFDRNTLFSVPEVVMIGYLRRNIEDVENLRSIDRKVYLGNLERITMEELYRAKAKAEEAVVRGEGKSNWLTNLPL